MLRHGLHPTEDRRLIERPRHDGLSMQRGRQGEVPVGDRILAGQRVRDVRIQSQLVPRRDAGAELLDALALLGRVDDSLQPGLPFVQQRVEIAHPFPPESLR